MPSNRVRLILKTAAATLAIAAVAAAAGGALVLKSGWYNVASTDQHFQFVHTLLEQGMRDSVRFHAREVAVPRLDAARIAQGALLYRDHCVQCHGAPGVAQQDFGKSMQPVPGPLVDAARHWQPAQLYWITKNGIKMSGMPAWEYHLADDELWSLVAFMVKLPELAPPAYAAMTAPSVHGMQAPAAPARWPGNPERGRIAMTQYACNACHLVPGVTGPDTYVGRPLASLGKRRFIAGTLPNTQENLVRWIRDPHAIDPLTAMPQQDVSEADAVDISAYLLTLR